MTTTVLTDAELDAMERTWPACAVTMLAVADALQERGQDLEAEAYRLLGERGLVGQRAATELVPADEHGPPRRPWDPNPGRLNGGYFDALTSDDPAAIIPYDWLFAATSLGYQEAESALWAAGVDPNDYEAKHNWMDERLYDQIEHRRLLARAYAKAEPTDRAAWAAQLPHLTPETEG